CRSPLATSRWSCGSTTRRSSSLRGCSGSRWWRIRRWARGSAGCSSGRAGQAGRACCWRGRRRRSRRRAWGTRRAGASGSFSTPTTSGGITRRCARAACGSARSRARRGTERWPCSRTCTATGGISSSHD
ncbi:MAG: Glyoxalase family protein, partial [uncultured Gemmatimonadetes bacterium]